MPTIHDTEDLTIEWTKDGTDYAKTCRELGIEEWELTEEVRGGGFTCTAIRRVNDPVLWTRNQRIRLRNDAGDVVFHGWCKEPRTPLKATSERHQYNFESATRFLQNTYRHAAIRTDAEGLHAWLSPNVVLNRFVDVIGGVVHSWLNALQQTTMILDYAKATGNCGGPAPFTYDLAGLTGYEVVMKARSNISCVTALESQLVWDPAIEWQWDMRNAIGPVMRMVRYNMATEPPTLTGAPYATIRTLPHDGTIIAECDPVPVDAMLAGKVEVIYVQSVSKEGGKSSDSRDVQVATEIATADNGSPRIETVLVNITGRSYLNLQWTGAQPVPAAGLAERMMNACRRVLWQHTFTSPTTGLHWEWRLGDMWNLTGMQPAHAASYSTTVRITRNSRGEVRVQTGPPGFLGMSELRQLGTKRGGSDGPTDEQASEQGGATTPEAGDGEKGDPGTNGENGATPTLSAGTLTIGAFEITVTPGVGVAAYVINLKVPEIRFGTSSFAFSSGPAGVTIGGDWATGFTMAISAPLPEVGPTVTLDPGEPATVTGTGFGGDPFIFSIPRGRDGDAAGVPPVPGDGRWCLRVTGGTVVWETF